MCGLCWTNTQVAMVGTESISKVTDSGRVADRHADDRLNCQPFQSAPEEIRTPNLLIRSQMLYPLSYGRMCSVV
jgi:hypothetical protein